MEWSAAAVQFLEAYKKLDFDYKDSVLIVMLTNSLNLGDLQRVKELGVAGFLSKPLTEEVLKEELSNHLKTNLDQGFRQKNLSSGTRITCWIASKAINAILQKFIYEKGVRLYHLTPTRQRWKGCQLPNFRTASEKREKLYYKVL